jgi:hypothetical protein
MLASIELEKCSFVKTISIFEAAVLMMLICENKREIKSGFACTIFMVLHVVGKFVVWL